MPVEAAGTVGEIHVKPGDKLPVGAPILTLDRGREAGRQTAPAAPPAKASKPAAPAAPQASDGKRPDAALGDGAKVEFKLPALGEGIDAGTITAVLVKPGDAVKAGQNVVAVETDKAAVEVPAEADGVVEAIHVKPGDKVPVGGKLLTLSGERGPSARLSRSADSATGRSRRAEATRARRQHGRTRAATRRRARSRQRQRRTRRRSSSPPDRRRGGSRANSASRSREVKGSGRGGRVTLDDVKGFVKTERQRVKRGRRGRVAAASIVNAFALPPLPDFAKFGPVEVQRRLATSARRSRRT